MKQGKYILVKAKSWNSVKLHEDTSENENVMKYSEVRYLIYFIVQSTLIM